MATRRSSKIAAPAETAGAAPAEVAVPNGDLSPEQLLRLRIKTAQAWRPNAGDVLTGTVVAILRAESEYGAYPKVIFDTGADNFVAFHAFHEVAKNELREAGVSKGWTGSIIFSGKVLKSEKRRTGDESKDSYSSYAVIAADDAGSDEEYQF